MDQLSLALATLTERVQALQAENAALKTQNEAYAAQEQAVVDAAGKVSALADSISSPPAAQ